MSEGNAGLISGFVAMRALAWGTAAFIGHGILWVPQLTPGLAILFTTWGGATALLAFGVAAIEEERDWRNIIESAIGYAIAGTIIVVSQMAEPFAWNW